MNRLFTRMASILTVGALTIATGALAQLASDSAGAKAPFAHLTVAGTIAFGTAKAIEFKSAELKNSGTLPASVTVTGPSQPSPFTVIAGAGAYSVEPGAEQAITVQFVPTAKGAVKGEITIACPGCNTKANHNLVVHLTGNAKGPVPTPTFTGPTATATATLTPAATPSPAAGANALPFSVTAGPFDTAEEGFASITVCATGTSNCTVVNDVLVDTGSTGLRIFGSQLSGLGISPNENNGSEVGECAFFGAGNTWGAVATVDVQIAGEPKITIPIQVMDDIDAFAPAPHDCTSTGTLESSPNQVGFNGLLGLGQTTNDVPNIFTEYFDCSNNGDCGTLENPSNGNIVLNPVSSLPVDNNGVVVSLPSVAADGAETVDGFIYFGIGTASNNQPGTVKVYRANTNINSDNYLDITTVYKGKSGPGFFDTGSNGFFFNSTIKQCEDAVGFYCPASTLSESATNKSAGGSTSGSVTFSIANADSLFNANGGQDSAFDNLGGTFDGGNSFDGFDWGLPFFFGRNVYLAINGASTPLGNGPYTAY
jgi:Protein of unknown function (DUF3443)